MKKNSTIYEKIYATVRQIPKGKVATYGQIAKLVRASGPRQIGYALHSLHPEKKVPWYRVVNAQGEISLRKSSEGHDLQREFLEAEGIKFSGQKRIDLKKYRWKKKIN